MKLHLFTLIELLVVIAIIAIIAILGLSRRRTRGGSGFIYRPKNGAAQNAGTRSLGSPMGLKSGVWGLRWV